MKWIYLIVCCMALGACGGDDARRSEAADGTIVERDQYSQTTTLVYTCNDYEFIARTAPGEMALWLQDRYVVLPQVVSASGALYEDEDVSFWSKGDEAMLTVADQDYQNCHQSPQRVPWEDARRRGVDFRAIGNEPGWYLEIQSGQQLLFVGEYGAARVVVPDTGVATEGPARIFHGAAGTQELRVEIVDQPCADTMSGVLFPSRVTVTLNNNTTYDGCGQSLDYPW